MFWILPDRSILFQPRIRNEYIMTEQLTIENLHVQPAEDSDEEILKGVNLTLNKGEIHALMGPNGSGKSTLAHSIMGNPAFEVTEGSVRLNGEDVLEMESDERARAGLFLAFQYPGEVMGVRVDQFLRTAVNERLPEDEEIPVTEFRNQLLETMDELNMDKDFAGRYLNAGFSGGEKKRNEILQMRLLEPEFAILDETDSGLDIDALQVVADGVNRQQKETNLGVLMITHYERILQYIEPDRVHVMMDGKIVESGDFGLAKTLEEEGYTGLRDELGLDIEIEEESEREEAGATTG